MMLIFWWVDILMWYICCCNCFDCEICVCLVTVACLISFLSFLFLFVFCWSTCWTKHVLSEQAASRECSVSLAAGEKHLTSKQLWKETYETNRHVNPALTPVIVFCPFPSGTHWLVFSIASISVSLSGLLWFSRHIFPLWTEFVFPTGFFVQISRTVLKLFFFIRL